MLKAGSAASTNVSLAASIIGLYGMHDTTVEMLVGNQSPNHRWRAGNLSQRQNTGKWIQSFTSPVDHKRPAPVQKLPPIDPETEEAPAGPPFGWSMGLMPELNQDETEFGFQTAVVVQAITPFDEEQFMGSEFLPIPGTEEDQPSLVITAPTETTEDWVQEYWLTAEDDVFGMQPQVGLDDTELYAQQLREIVDDVETFGFQTAVVTVITGFDQDEGIEYLEIVTHDTESDQFGFQTPRVVQAPDDLIEHLLPETEIVTDDVEGFGFNASLPTMDYTVPDDLPREWCWGMLEDEGFGLGVAFAETQQEQDLPRPQLSWALEAEDTLIAPILSWDDVEQAIVQLPYMVTYMQDTDTMMGFPTPILQPVFLDYGIEQGSFPVPVWMPDLEDYDVGMLAVIPISLIVPKIWNFIAQVQVMLADVQVRPQARISVMSGTPQVKVQDVQVRA